MDKDLFCKIVNHEIESRIIYEDETVIAILDAYPEVDGHTMIIPKKHYTDYKDLDEIIINHILNVAKIIEEKLMAKLNATGIMIAFNYGDRQAIKHFHLHLLPDYNKNKATKDLDEIYKLLTEE